MSPQGLHRLTQSGEFRSGADRYVQLGYRSATDHDRAEVPWSEVAASPALSELLRPLRE